MRSSASRCRAASSTFADERPTPSSVRCVKRSPELSVVVCSHNGALHLRDALSRLSRQTLDRARYEVLVVDDGSTDETPQIAIDAGVDLLRLDANRGLAAARNAGVARARSPIVAFTDDDCMAAADWAHQILGAFADPAVQAAGGAVIPGGPESFNVRYLRRHNPLMPLGAELMRRSSAIARLGLYLRAVTGSEAPLDAGAALYSVVGANMAFRRDVLQTLGGFDDAFRFGAEEEDFCRRLHEMTTAGARIVFRPQAVVEHRFAASVNDTLRRSRAYGHGNARRALKHGDRRPIVFPTPVAVVMLAFSGILARRSRLLIVALLAPLCGYPSWLSRADWSVERLLDPYLQLAQELWTMRGEIDGYRAGYVPRAGAPASFPTGPGRRPGDAPAD